MAKANETQVPTETEQNNLKIFDKVSNSVNINHKNCSYCNKPFTEELWCKECDPRRMIEGWTSGNNDVDKFIKDTIYDVNKKTDYKVKFLEWAPFDRFEDVKEIGVGGFAKVYSATWIDGKAVHYNIQDLSWKKTKPKPIKVALKRLNGSENMSAEYLNELKIHWNLYKEGGNTSIAFYGMTKDPETEEFMMILQFADEGNLRSVLSHNFKNILWTDKIKYLYWLIYGLKDLHDLGYFHKDFHSGNILRVDERQTSISDFGLSGPSNKQKSDDKICGVLPYIAPEVLNGEPYTYLQIFIVLV
ncbi:kinase-like domain-containing protein [Rhizophagus irregularis DAOM 181602=DAOM 197198]|uniref:Cdc15p n=2 Tax=Rhizophagus irregularis TaxID=588596 RepID=A0A015K0S3_RHIIW|nr:kinase-like domain-containing protein [Rhizophagus irregularis DAOM 181602=DAOM 197198]EXX53026.1 Cdc15p [Rhizophagus irregularis DAOM 197198w]POG65762.1 kinase-like domain-containing protein [Rhizophagus irregularis DAOM 181602=DAOM 197198]|eukprot:XP_025172628.1 kinase-like domain-containing protein [Rhizophagus irregularis DAOM 181602=DAOM 197198]